MLREIARQHRFRHTLDPRHVETERLGAADVERVRGDEQHLGGRRAEHPFDQRVGQRAGLEDFPCIDADGGVEHRVEAACANQRSEHRRTAVRENCALKAAQRRKRCLCVGIGVETQIPVHQAVDHHRLTRQIEATQRENERFAGHHRKILVTLHQGAQPGVFELFQPPDLGDNPAIAGKALLGHIGDRLDIVESAVGVEHDSFDGHGGSRGSERTGIAAI